MLNLMPVPCVDLVVTSPPYDGLRDYNGYSFDYKEVGHWIYDMLKDGGVCVWVVNNATVKGSKTLTAERQAIYFMDEVGFLVHDDMVYRKPNFSNPSRNRYHQVWEHMYVFSKGKPKTFNPIKDRPNKYAGKVGNFGKNTVRQKDGTQKTRRRKVNTKFGMRHNVWDMKTAGQETPGLDRSAKHPAPFPYKLPYDHIRTWSNEGDFVLDPMCGGGTTLRAAKDLGRYYWGIDISKEYCEMAKTLVCDD
jgi:site-specific DNA-methyltransferase (adenine-specific)